MMVVLDTNVLLQALNPRHEYARIMDDWYAGRFIWAISTDILMEYREVIVRQSGAHAGMFWTGFYAWPQAAGETCSMFRHHFSFGPSQPIKTMTNSRIVRLPRTQTESSRKTSGNQDKWQ